ncbi:family 43 glycosylhydrolase [Actinomadura sp. LOL_016]|uniref:family 43 glycosylhydrolase n=1 Tax=unclassified Actinomadura TaxID=2626254 RepID=UPI003A80A31F
MRTKRGVPPRVLGAATVSGVLASLALIVLVVVSLPGGGPGNGPAPAAAAPSPSSPPRSPLVPVIASNFADPDVIKHDGVYYAYATNDRGVRLPVARASAVGGPWERLNSDGLSALGAWAADGRTWAPEVTPGPGGTLLLYYTAHHRSSGEQCIGVATASNPVGPFRPVGADPLVCPHERSGAIDAAAFTDVDGTRYLLYKSDGHGSGGHPPAIYLQRLSADGLRTEGEPHRILTRDPDVDPTLIEAPALVRRGDRYVLFYAAGVFFDSSYRTGYAAAETIIGPYERGPEHIMTTEGYAEEIVGPGGADVFSDETGDHIVYHGILRFYDDGHVDRGMYIADLGWAGHRPVVQGSPVRYEAEHARVHRAEVVSGRTNASGERAAGRLDHADSWVEFDIFAVAAGDHRVRVGYATRTAEPARHALIVNGTAAAEASYPVTGQEDWGVTTVQADLRAGWNTLRLRRVAGFAEIDYVEVVT